jgi:peroxiredoxin
MYYLGRRYAFAGLFGVFVMSLAGLAWAAAGPPATPIIDAQAAAVLSKMADFYSNSTSALVGVKVVIVREAPGQKNEMGMYYLVAMKRPNRVAFLQRSGSAAETVVCDGTTVTTYVPQLGVYTVQNAPADMDALLDSRPRGGATQTLFVDMLFRGRPYQAITEGSFECRYLGEVDLNGVLCHALRFQRPEAIWNMWVDAGARPTVRKVSLDMTRSDATRPGNAPPDTKMTMDLTFDNWSFGPAVSDSYFVFRPPAEARKVDSLEQAARLPGPHPLVGQPSPNLVLDLLGGGAANLAALRGKYVIVLDFWATWCNPCERSLPIIAQVAADYRNKGVVFYAINMREEPQVVNGFLRRVGVNCPVAFDREGVAANAYAVESIPQTVVIGRDGTVRRVHVGFSPTLQTDLQKDLDEILAGR